MNGTVKRFERGDMIVDLGKTEAISRATSSPARSATDRASGSARSSTTSTRIPRGRSSCSRARIRGS